MKDQMQIGELALFYHSNAKPSGVAGVARISKLAQPDPTQFDTQSDYFDEQATLKKPRWFCVEVEYVEAFSSVISLEELRHQPALKDLELLRRGSRLSVHPVSKVHFQHILKMANSKFSRNETKHF